MKSNYLFCLFAFLLFAPFCLDAQNTKDTKLFKYQGEVDLGASAGFDDETFNLSLDIVNGVRFSRHFFAGMGLGLATSFSDEAVLVPIYGAFKGYFPVKDRLDFTAGLDLGTKLDYSYGMSGGILVRPEYGLNFPMKGKVGMRLTLFYEYYSCNYQYMEIETRVKTNQLGLKLGVSF